jgi:hypothetical protein
MKRVLSVACALFAMGVLGGCGGGGAQHPSAEPPTDAVVPAAPTTSQGSPTTGQPLQHDVPTNQPGDPLATGWRYRIEMSAPPNDNFAITNRDFYLFFKPDTSAVHFRIENRRGVAARSCGTNAPSPTGSAARRRRCIAGSRMSAATCRRTPGSSPTRCTPTT